VEYLGSVPGVATPPPGVRRRYTVIVESPYRAQRPEPPGPPSYVKEWRGTKWASVLALCQMLMGVVLLWGVRRFGDGAVMRALTEAWVLAWLLLIVAMRFLLRCPRCHKMFDFRWGMSFETNQCLHCGLPRGAPTDPDWKPPT
jgi:hypothetical protein